MVGFEPDPTVLGSPFYVMHHVDGVVPGDNPHFTVSGWVKDGTAADRERLWRSAVQQLVAVHSVPPDVVAFLARPDAAGSGLEQDLAYWRAAYRWAAGSEHFPVTDAAEEWLLAHLPPEPAPGLAWGDARIENMIFRDFELVALLDPESASLAGPAADLAWWALMDRGTKLPGLGTPRQTVTLWEELAGRKVEHLHYFLVLCAFRLSAVYIRLAHQLEQRGQLSPDRKDLARNSEKMQQLAMLLDLPVPGPGDARLPDVL
jgi:aminoglycoside phosphotransferase (APT) family kinase protein